MTVVSGASNAALGGVLGVTAIEGTLRSLELGLLVPVVIGCGIARAALDDLDPCCRLMLLRFSPTAKFPPAVFPLPKDFVDEISGLLGGLLSIFRDPDVKTFLIFAPGDIPRRPLEATASGALRDCSLCCRLFVATFRGARSNDSEASVFEMGNVVDFGPDGRMEESFDCEETSGSTTSESLPKGEVEPAWSR